MNRITKEIEKHLKEIASMMPEIPIAKTEIKKGSELLQNASEEDLNGRLKDFHPDKLYKVQSGGALQAVNHLKRLKSAYMQNGWPGVEKYIEPFRRKTVNAESKNPEVYNEK